MLMESEMIGTQRNEENDLDLLVELYSFFSDVFEMSKSTYEAVINSAFYENACDVLKTLDESADKLSKVYKGIKVVASIPDRLFLRKFEKLCLGVGTIPEDKRVKYIQRISKKKFNKETAFILDVISRVEDLSKIDILNLLWEAKMDGKIDDEKFRRYVIMTANTMLQDLQYMANNITNDDFYISSMEEEGLVCQGWIIYSGLGIGTATESGGNLYKYTSAAKEFCECVWNKVASDEKKNGAIMFTGGSISNEEIEKLF